MTERKSEWALYQPASSAKTVFQQQRLSQDSPSLCSKQVTEHLDTAQQIWGTIHFGAIAPEASWIQLIIVNECGIISDDMEESTSFLVKHDGPDKHQLFVNSNLAYYIVCIGLTKIYT